MPRIRISKIRLQVSTDPASQVFTPLTADSDYYFDFEGGELIFLKGVGSVVLSSVPDPQRRLGDITYLCSDSADPAEIYGPFMFPGWRQSDGGFHISAISGSVSISVLSPAR